MLLRGFTIHRGMFHSLPMALMYGSGTALVFGSLGKNAALAVGLVAGAGVLSHLVLDAAAGFTLGPLKLCSRRIGPSLAAWFFALLLTALAWSRAA
jgi:membrane-bound metal-dependent hydrolase YbcI (DUF457 family)